MEFHITPEASLRLCKFSTALICCWPPPNNASKFELLIYDILCFLAFISAICLLIPLLISVYQDREDSVIMLKSVYLSCAAAHVANKILICRIYRHHLKASSYFVDLCLFGDKHYIYIYIYVCVG